MALAAEGAKHNIRVSTIAPAGTTMTRTVLSEEIVQALKPQFVASFVAVLCAKEDSGNLYEIGRGWCSQTWI
jgi:NAD(P)-dependent dehydrogenase (short-subunit alcohol dehydrogenase family)